MPFNLIIDPFVTTLTFLYSLLGSNIVLAIVVFTVLVRLITYPLTMQQQRSTKAMQQLQPELKKLQEKYKNDREKLAAEQMALYRQFGINPMGGCLPLVIQLPIMLGLYQAIIFSLAATPWQLMELSGRLLIPGLDHLIPLQNTVFGLNITQPPSSVFPITFILPILVVITTWLQFKSTMPAAAPNDDGKPNQGAAMTQSMGTIMPVMYGFFALQFSLGLSIYFIVSNLVGIIQYAAMGKTDFRTMIGLKPKNADKSPVIVQSKLARSTSSDKPKNDKAAPLVQSKLARSNNSDDKPKASVKPSKVK